MGNAILGPLNPVWLEWLMGFPMEWTAASLGNALVPQIAEWIGRAHPAIERSIVGGPHDGKLVPNVGPVFREPVARPLGAGTLEGVGRLPSPEGSRIEYRMYDLYRWRTESGVDAPRYVLREQAKGLGAAT
jgi:hypothetical protein